MLDRSAICATSTSSEGFIIAVIRLSGAHVIDIANEVFLRWEKGKSLDSQPTNKLHFGQLVYKKSVVVEVIAALFRASQLFKVENIL